MSERMTEAYPADFLGRCQTCLGNAILSNKRCRTGFGQGMPLFESDCLIARCQDDYNAGRAALASKGGK